MHGLNHERRYIPEAESVWLSSSWAPQWRFCDTALKPPNVLTSETMMTVARRTCLACIRSSEGSLSKIDPYKFVEVLVLWQWGGLQMFAVDTEGSRCLYDLAVMSHVKWPLLGKEHLKCSEWCMALMEMWSCGFRSYTDCFRWPPYIYTDRGWEKRRAH